MSKTDIGGIGNYYGGLTLHKRDDGSFAWSIENWDGHDWQDIPAPLGEALLKYERSRRRAEKAAERKAAAGAQ